MATITAEKMRAFIIDKETGEKRELPTPVGTIQVGECETQQEPTGRYSFSVKVKCQTRMTRKNRKFVRSLMCFHKVPKYVAKASIAKTVLTYKHNDKTYEELMSMTRRNLGRYAARQALGEVLDNMLRDEHRVVPVFQQGGIIGCYPTINRPEVVMTDEERKRLAKEVFLGKPFQEETPSIDMFEAVRIASELKHGAPTPEILPMTDDIKVETIKLTD